MKTAKLENLESELKDKEKAINVLLAAIEQGIVTKINQRIIDFSWDAKREIRKQNFAWKGSANKTTQSEKKLKVWPILS